MMNQHVQPDDNVVQARPESRQEVLRELAEAQGRVDDETYETMVRETMAALGLSREQLEAGLRDIWHPRTVSEMNGLYFVMRYGSKTMVASFCENGLGRMVLQPEHLKDFHARLSNVRVLHQGKHQPLSSVWMNSPTRRTYSGADVVPDGPRDLPNGKLNLWQGFDIAPRAGEWARIWKHIKYVLADGNEEHFDYIVRWFAWVLQHPAERTEVAVVFRSLEGSGKGSILNMFARAFGAHGRTIRDPKQLTGSFNAHLRGALFLLVDEGFFAGDPAAAGKLKGLITEPTLTIESKGIDAVEDRNMLSLVMSTNSDWAVPAGENARRFAVFDCSNAHAQGKEDAASRKVYFDALHGEMESGGFAAFMHALLAMNLKGWHPRTSVPQTRALQTQKALSLRGWNAWWVSILQQGRLPGSGLTAGIRRSAGTNNAFILSSAAAEDARRLFPRYAGDFSPDGAGRYLSAFGCWRSKSKEQGTRGWLVPPLSEARQAWESRFGMWPWDDPEQKNWE